MQNMSWVNLVAEQDEDEITKDKPQVSLKKKGSRSKSGMKGPSSYAYFIKWAKETKHTPCKKIESGSNFFGVPSILKSNVHQDLSTHSPMNQTSKLWEIDIIKHEMKAMKMQDQLMINSPVIKKENLSHNKTSTSSKCLWKSNLCSRIMHHSSDKK